MGLCPSCGKRFELHATVGLQTGLRLGDTAVCIGCASALVLEELPYEFRLMTRKELEELDYGTRKLLEKARQLSEKTALKRSQLEISTTPTDRDWR